MTPGPIGIVRGASKSDHAAIEKKEAQQRENHHAVRRAANVRNRIEGNLAAECGGVVAPKLCHQSVGGFMAGGRKKERHIEDESECQELGREVGHSSESLEFQVAESKQTSAKRAKRDEIAKTAVPARYIKTLMDKGYASL